MSVSPYLDIYSVLVGTIERQSITIPIRFPTGPKKDRKIIDEHALIDCGAGGRFIDQNYARKLNLPLIPLSKPLPVKNVDGTPNKKGSIRHKVRLRLKIGNRYFKETLLVSGLGRQKIILGLPWLTEHNPDINWQTGVIKWRDPDQSIKRIRTTIEEEPDNREWMDRTVNKLDTPEHTLEERPETDNLETPDDSLTISFINGELNEEAKDIWINTKVTTSQAFAQKYEEKDNFAAEMINDLKEDKEEESEEDF